MKKKISKSAIGIIILIGIIIIILVTVGLKTRMGGEGYGLKYKIPDDYKFIITNVDMSAVDGASSRYFVYEDKIIEQESLSTLLQSTNKVILYEDVDTSNIEYEEDEETNAIIQGNRKSLQAIKEAIQNKKGKIVCDYTVKHDD